MMLSSKMTKLVFIGGTGRLGGEIAKGLITSDFQQHVAVVRRSSLPTSMEKIEKLISLGWTIHEVDAMESNSKELIESMKDVNVIVSTLGGPSLKRTEMAILDAAIKANQEQGDKSVQLFVPSQFGVDYRRWHISHPIHKNKEAVLQYAQSLGVPTLSVFNGVLSDIIFHALTDLKNMKATIVNGGNHLVSFTRRSDIGYVLAKALSDPEYNKGGHLSMQGSIMTWRDALTLIEPKVGKSFDISDITAEEALQKEKELLAAGDMSSFGMHLLGEPARGSPGFDVSAEAVDLGIQLEPLTVTLDSMFSASTNQVATK
jgi:uncharacterized protein YbjT (DUF2867 family)